MRSFVLSALLLVGTGFIVPTASADTSWQVTRHQNYEAWRLLRARLDRQEASTELLRVRARAISSESQIREERQRARQSDRAWDGERTLGRACIYGAKDEVLYAPKGKDCSR